jgi:DNA-binding NarL/FixJ family response regulator
MLKHRVHNRAELLSAVRTVAQGGSWIDPEVVGMLVARHAGARHSIIRELSAPEVELLALIGHGASNAAIAERLALTQQTAESRIDSLLRKLGLGDAGAVGHRVKATLLLLADSTVQPAR